MFNFFSSSFFFLAEQGKKVMGNKKESEEVKLCHLFSKLFFLNNIFLSAMFTYYSDNIDPNDPDTSTEDKDYVITCKKRVVQFIQKWVIAVRNTVFENQIAVEFIEV